MLLYTFWNRTFVFIWKEVMKGNFQRLTQFLQRFRKQDTVSLEGEHDPVSTWEKIAITINVLSSSLNIARWYAGSAVIDRTIGSTVMDWIILIFAILAGASMDFAVVATMLGKRAGRRGVWSNLTALSATLFAALISLDMYGNTEFGAALHIANACTVYFLLQHLSQPKQAPRSLYVLKSEHDMLLEANKANQALIDTQKRLLDTNQQKLDAAAKAEQEKVQFVQRIMAEKTDLEKKLKEFKPSDELIVEALASGSWTLARIAEELSAYTGSQNQAATKLGTSPQNLSNWINKKG
jgi:hypothetical protein